MCTLQHTLCWTWKGLKWKQASLTLSPLPLCPRNSAFAICVRAAHHYPNTNLNFVYVPVNIGGSRPLRLGNLAAASALASPPVFSPTSVLPPRNPWNQMWQHHDSFVQQNTMNHHLAANMSVPRIVVPTHSMVPMFPSPDSASKLWLFSICKNFFEFNRGPLWTFSVPFFTPWRAL